MRRADKQRALSWDTGVDASMEDTCRRAFEVGLPAVTFIEHVDFNRVGCPIGQPERRGRRSRAHLDPTAATDDDFSPESSRVSRDDHRYPRLLSHRRTD
jgi:hypothetical protein